LIFNLTVVACIVNAIVTIITFFLYVSARLGFREAAERRYMAVHFITLALFVLFGVLVLIQLSHRFNPKVIY
jgi:cytochrome bd-type quinol oxidase subunit 2